MEQAICGLGQLSTSGPWKRLGDHILEIPFPMIGYINFDAFEHIC